MNVWTERVLIGGRRRGGAATPGIAHLGLHVEGDQAAGVDMRRDLYQHAGVDVCDVVVTALPSGRRADDGLLIDRDPGADLDRGLLIVQRGDVRVADHLGVAVLVEQAQRRCDAAWELRAADEVRETRRSRSRSTAVPRRDWYRRVERGRTAGC